MQIKQDEYDVGVIVGRFQVNDLHQAHIDLIQSVCDEHAKVIIFLGLAPVINTINNPLDFEPRKQLLQHHFPEIIVAYISDVNNDDVWSKHLDSEIHKLLSPTQDAVLYGGRDSFITTYTGKHSTRELHQEVYVSGTDIRRSLSKKVKASPDFRHGVVWASANRFPTVFTTVDVAIFRDNYGKILLGRKEHEDRYRLIGGFADPSSTSFEADAYREMQEETGLYHLDPSKCMDYLGSYNIDDWRYRGEVDSIRTMLFACDDPLGMPKPDDDIVELKWFDITHLSKTLGEVVPQHHTIVNRALSHAHKQQKTIATKG